MQALIPKLRSGAISESSFAFRCNQDSWSADRTQRTMLECDIHRGDVSSVTFGASPGTGRYMQMRRQGSLQELHAVTAAISAAGMGGPGADLYRAAWANQHGSSCRTCDGSGTCPDCNGAGWLSTDQSGTDDPDQDQNAARRRSSIVIPAARYEEFEAELRRIQAVTAR